jgi:hypothetical protein
MASKGASTPNELLTHPEGVEPSITCGRPNIPLRGCRKSVPEVPRGVQQVQQAAATSPTRLLSRSHWPWQGFQKRPLAGVMPRYGGGIRGLFG